MSRPWMPWYIGDYLRDTGHLNTEQHGAYLLLLAHCWQYGSIPPASAERAAIAKLTPARWKAIGGPVVRFFNEDGTQNRVTREIARTERAIMQRKLAGSSGGKRSAISRAIKRGEMIADAQSELQREAKQNRSNRLPSAQADSRAKTELPRTNHIREITTSESVAAREEEAATSAQAGSLASALPKGALASQNETQVHPTRSKPPSQVTRAEIDAMLVARRQPK